MIPILIFITNLFFTTLHSATQTDASIGTILIFRGNNIDVFSAGAKVNLEEGMAPYKIYAGDEIKLGKNSKCELLLTDGGLLRLAPETQISMEWFSQKIINLSIRYGTAFYDGTNEIYFRSRGMILKSKGGNFIVKYNRAKLEASIYNTNSDIDVKHIWSKKVYRLKPLHYLTLASYDSTIRSNKLNTNIISRVLALLKVDYKPNGQTVTDTSVPGKNPKSSKLPYTQAANLDLIKRNVGI